MTKFIVKKKEFRQFLDVACMKGTIHFRDSKKVKNKLFPSFDLKVTKYQGRDALKAIALDPHSKKARARFVLTGITIKEEGSIPITDYDILKNVLKRKGLPKGNIMVEAEGSTIELTNIKTEDSYTVRQQMDDSYEIYSSDNEKLAKQRNQLKAWDEMCSIKDGELFIDKGDGIEFPTHLKMKKTDLEKITDDAIHLTQDNKTPFVFDGEQLLGKKGKGNSNVKSKHPIPVDVIKGEEEFDCSFYNIQSIIPNMFREIEFFTKQGAKSTSMWIRSTHQNIDANVSLASVIEDD